MRTKTHVRLGSLVWDIPLALRKDPKEGVERKKERKSKTDATADVIDAGDVSGRGGQRRKDMERHVGLARIAKGLSAI
jgi:hypothetical protein